jgi:hypothetical protein
MTDLVIQHLAEMKVPKERNPRYVSGCVAKDAVDIKMNLSWLTVPFVTIKPVYFIS